MLIHRLSAALIAILASSGALSAQTADHSRLTLGVFGGVIGGQQLWSVSNQPIISTTPGLFGPTVFSLRRETHSDITIGGHMAYYGSPHLGITGEFTFVGLGTSDACQVVQDGGDPDTRDACTGLAGSDRTSSVTTVQLGFSYRPLIHSSIQPYFNVLGGAAFTPSSMIHTESRYTDAANNPLALTIYTDDHVKSVRPSWTAAIGLATAPSSGYQIRVEVRDTWLPVSTVTGPTSGQGFVPPNRSVIKGFPSILVGFDVVLEKSRGRRY